MTSPFPRRCSGRTLGIFGLTLAQAGCGAGWRRTAELPLGALPPGRQAQVWRGGRVERLHAVIITADSLSGVPFLRPRNCDTCRVALPRAEVDSVRLGHPERGFWKGVGVALGGAVVLALVACGLSLGGDCQLGD